jgi:hypothetical protein
MKVRIVFGTAENAVTQREHPSSKAKHINHFENCNHEDDSETLRNSDVLSSYLLRM